MVDSSALFAVVGDEPLADSMAKRLAETGSVRISAATKVELSLVVKGRLGEAGLRRLEGLMGEIGIETIPFDDEQALMAIEANRRFGKGSGSPARLNLGDCFSYALAKALDIPLLFIGDDFVHTDIRSAMAS